MRLLPSLSQRRGPPHPVRFLPGKKPRVPLAFQGRLPGMRGYGYVDPAGSTSLLDVDPAPPLLSSGSRRKNRRSQRTPEVIPESACMPANSPCASLSESPTSITDGQRRLLPPLPPCSTKFDGDNAEEDSPTEAGPTSISLTFLSPLSSGSWKYHIAAELAASFLTYRKRTRPSRPPIQMAGFEYYERFKHMSPCRSPPPA